MVRNTQWLYSCSKFGSMSHDEMIALLKLHSHCLNCLIRPDHFVKSVHHCKVCQKRHHSLLHIDRPPRADHTDVQANHASVRILLLMTCHHSPHGVMQVRALLDLGSPVSFCFWEGCSSTSILSHFTGRPDLWNNLFLLGRWQPLSHKLRFTPLLDDLMWVQSLFLAWPVIYPHIQFLSIVSGSTSMAYDWPIQNLASQERWTSYLVWIPLWT